MHTIKNYICEIYFWYFELRERGSSEWFGGGCKNLFIDKHVNMKIIKNIFNNEKTKRRHINIFMTSSKFLSDMKFYALRIHTNSNSKFIWDPENENGIQQKKKRMFWYLLIVFEFFYIHRTKFYMYYGIKKSIFSNKW